MVLPVTTLPVCRERQPLKFTVAKFHRMAEGGVLEKPSAGLDAMRRSMSQKSG